MRAVVSPRMLYLSTSLPPSTKMNSVFRPFEREVLLMSHPLPVFEACVNVVALSASSVAHHCYELQLCDSRRIRATSTILNAASTVNTHERILNRQFTLTLIRVIVRLRELNVMMAWSRHRHRSCQLAQMPRTRQRTTGTCPC
jgi:hypothetical protein